MASELHSFVRDALAAGQPKPEITKALQAAGWQTDEISAAVGSFADVPFPIPVPRRKPYLSARETFIYLVLFTCLYLSAYNFGALLFQFIERAFPDALQYYYEANSSAIRMAVSSLIVAFPIYIWLTRLTLDGIRRDPDKKASKIRKWLTYLTLFVAAGIIIGDLIAINLNLLGGELTVRFALKVLTVLLIAGLVFGYYLWDLRTEEKEK